MQTHSEESQENNKGLRESTDRNGPQSRQGRNITLIGAVVNLFLIAIKFVAGLFGHSQALIADAVHSVSDLFTDAVVLLGLRMGRKGPDQDHHFGHARYETLACDGGWESDSRRRASDRKKDRSLPKGRVR